MRVTHTGTRAGALYRSLSLDDAALYLCQFTCAPEVSRAERLVQGRAAIERLIDAGLPFAEGAEGRQVDGVELFNACKGVEDPAWREGMVPSWRAVIDRYREGLERKARGLESRVRLVLWHRRRWVIDDRPVGSPLRLGFALPLEDALRKTTSVEVIEAAGMRASISSDSVLLRGAVPSDRMVEAEIRVTTEIDCDLGGTMPVVDGERSAWLREDEPPAFSAQGVELARGWTSRCVEPIDKLRAIWDGLGERLRCGFLHPEDRELDPLVLGWTDCWNASRLLIAMSRAVGVPARLVSGMLVYVERPSVPHFWVEAWLPDRGWTPFDWSASLPLAELPDDRARWREHFFGQLDYRLIFDRYPRSAFAATGTALPASWYRVERMELDGRHACEYRRAADRRLLYVDLFRVEEPTQLWI